MLCPHHIKGFMSSICLLTSDAYLDHLANLVPTRFLHYKQNYITYTLWAWLPLPLDIKFLRFMGIIVVLFVPFHCHRVFHCVNIPPSLSASMRGGEHQLSPSPLPVAVFVLVLLSTVVQHTTWNTNTI